jgi:hypothetical protein
MIECENDKIAKWLNCYIVELLNGRDARLACTPLRFGRRGRQAPTWEGMVALVFGTEKIVTRYSRFHFSEHPTFQVKT